MGSRLLPKIHLPFIRMQQIFLTDNFLNFGTQRFGLRIVLYKKSNTKCEVVSKRWHNLFL